MQASGNVTVDTVHKIGQTGVTYISRYFLATSIQPIMELDYGTSRLNSLC